MNAYPDHIAVDEKHTTQLGEKAPIATTVANECVLGASVTDSAGEDALKEAYHMFKHEAQDLRSDSTPQTVNTDGWHTTQNALKALFPSLISILCVLHVSITIRDRAKKKFHGLFQDVASTLWNCDHAATKRSFSQRVRRLHEWAQKQKIPPVMVHPITTVLHLFVNSSPPL